MFIPIHDANGLKHIGLHYGTLGIIAANILVFIFFETPLATSELFRGLGLIPLTFNGTVARPEDIAFIPEQTTLLTHAFLHADVWHLVGNMVFLWVFGDNVEDALGHLRFVLFYAFCAMGGGFLHVIMTPNSPDVLIGASGAVAGVVAAYVILHPRVRVWVLFLSKIPLRVPAFVALGAWIVLQFFFAFRDGDIAVAWWAHVGGIVTGAVLVVILRRRGVLLFDRGLQTAAEQP